MEPSPHPDMSLFGGGYLITFALLFTFIFHIWSTLTFLIPDVQPEFICVSPEHFDFKWTFFSFSRSHGQSAAI